MKKPIQNLSPLRPVYNGPSVAIRPSVCGFVALFENALLSSSLSYIELMCFIVSKSVYIV